MSDVLVLDVPAAHDLVAALTVAAEELFSDQLVLRGLLDEAATSLRRDQRDALVPVASARTNCESLAADLRSRLELVERTTRGLDRIDVLSRELSRFRPRSEDVDHDRLRHERRVELLRLVDHDLDSARRVEAALGRGLDAVSAFRAVDAELRLESRIETLRATFSIDEAAARAMIERVDAGLAELLERGHSEPDALSALAIVEHFGLDLAEGLAHAAMHGIELLEALGRLLVARSLGLTPAEYHALAGLEAHFAVFDNATGGRRDQRVSAADLEHVVTHPRRFTPAQVLAAQALLDEPLLRNRLDTADAHTDLFGGDRFGSTERGDGLIAEADLRAFHLKARLHTVLRDHADVIDIANDPSGIVDGYHSKNDLEAFLADNPDLPEPVRDAARIALDAGWFDESWWQAHKDELAMGAALLAAGLVVVASGGGASMLLVAGAGALAAGATTITVNLATGAPMLEDSFMNAVRGGFIGGGVHGVAAGAAAYGTATTGIARVAAMTGATSGAADVVAAGGVDLLIDEEHEARVHAVANEVATITGAVDLGHGVGEWATRRDAVFDSVEDQLAALSDRISRQRQLRHVRGSSLHARGGFFDDPADAQRVLDAVHDGSADVLGMTRGQDLLVRYDEVTGIHVSRGVDAPGLVTTTFTIKGTTKPSVVPVRPGKLP